MPLYNASGLDRVLFVAGESARGGMAPRRLAWGGMALAQGEVGGCMVVGRSLHGGRVSELFCCSDVLMW